jgi:DNA-binding transcriptional regulator YhcF (GntR family)
MKDSPENAVDSLAEAISLQILRGKLAPGARLPSVRALAATHEVNVSTIQRVLAKLEQQGLVRTQPRSGVVVLDPQRNGGTALLAIVLRHASVEKTRAVAMLRDALGTRRVLALHVARTLCTVPFDSYGDALRRAIERFCEVAVSKKPALSAVADAENEILRTALVAADMPAVLAVVNDLSAMLKGDTSVLRSFYSDPGPLVSGWRAFVEMLAAGGSPDRFAFLEPFLASIDARVVRDFEASLGEKKR